MIQRATRRKPGAAPAEQRALRVAVYTRLSLEKGLEKEFNSIDAQREASEAFVLSQRAEGWVLVPDRYDDGGFSGATIERPALQRLLADMEAGRVDCVVVHRVDRLSRSLLDFARLLETFDRCQVEFVSVTQQFNTTTPGGRLFLHMLLSFGQYEREMISERTATKMAATRRRGMWTGGPVPLGYDLVEKKLVPNAAEAEHVRKTFALYLQQGSLLSTLAELQRRGSRTKSWRTRENRTVPGREFNKGTLRALLSNAAYVGQVNFRGETYVAAHEAIIDRATWDAAQALLKKNGNRGASETRNKWGALLPGGLLRCAACGSGMHHHQSRRGSKVWRAYVCEKYLKEGASACPGSRVPANRIEAFIVDRIRAIGRDSKLLEETLRAARTELAAKKPVLEADIARLQQERRKLEGERTNLVAAVGQGGIGTKALLSRLAEGEDEVAKLDERERGLRDEIATLEGRVISEDDVRDALGQFDDLWATLFPREREWIVRLLIERVVFDGRTGDVEVRFHSTGIKELAAELGAAVKETRE